MLFHTEVCSNMLSRFCMCLSTSGFHLSLHLYCTCTLQYKLSLHLYCTCTVLICTESRVLLCKYCTYNAVSHRELFNMLSRFWMCLRTSWLHSSLPRWSSFVCPNDVAPGTRNEGSVGCSGRVYGAGLLALNQKVRRVSRE